MFCDGRYLACIGTHSTDRLDAGVTTQSAGVGWRSVGSGYRWGLAQQKMKQIS